MHPGLVYMWGALGGFVAAVFVHVVPGVTRMLHTGELDMARPRVVAATVLVALLAAGAGVVSLIPDDITRGQAISLGLASQAIVKGLISGARDALPPQPP